MTTPDNQIEPGPAAERIVSVNDYGGRARSLTPSIMTAAVVIAIAVTGGWMTINRYRAQAGANRQADAKAMQRGDAPAVHVPRRVFDTTSSAGTAATAAPPPATRMSEHCDDGQSSVIFKDKDGLPIMAPTGLPVRICPNGQILIPPLPTPAATPNREPPVAPDGSKSPDATQGRAAPVNRDGGDILLPQAPAPAPVMEKTSSPVAPQASLGSPAAPQGTAAENAPAHPRGSLRALLDATPTVAVRAALQGDRDLILSEGRTIDCNLALRVISDVSGKAVCVLSADVYGDSGAVVLAERGSVATGEYIALGAQGQRRLFIIWTRLKTSRGVVINLNSPAADALGTSGLEGYVDNRWPERIGAALLLSTVQDAIGYETAKASSGTNSNGATGIAVFAQTTQTGNRLAERILDSTINIPPTIYKRQGDRASITVAQDLDFGSVYALRTQ